MAVIEVVSPAWRPLVYQCCWKVPSAFTRSEGARSRDKSLVSESMYWWTCFRQPTSCSTSIFYGPVWSTTVPGNHFVTSRGLASKYPRRQHVLLVARGTAVMSGRCPSRHLRNLRPCNATVGETPVVGSWQLWYWNKNLSAVRACVCSVVWAPSYVL